MADGTATNAILGAVLAGGRSRRFGSDKAVARVGDRTLIECAIASLAPHAAQVVVCGRDMPGLTSLPDRPAPDQGPLGGLAAALHFASRNGFAGVLTTGCDMPVFPAAAVGELVGDSPAIVDGLQLVGYWPSALAILLDTHLAATQDRSIRGWMAQVHPRIVTLAEPLPNINTPADLEAFLRRG